MPSFSELTGQDHVAQRLRAAVAHDRLHHAYLFTCADPAVSGRAAVILAAAINCERAPGEGCAPGPSACASCEKIDQGIHPDVVTLAREGASQQVPIETVRAQVVSRVGLPPHEARVRVFVIEEATALAGPAANALLKTLEEPPARTMFVLSTVAPEQLLPTIRSRCQRLAFAPVAADRALRAEDAAAAERLRELADELAWFDRRRTAPSEVATRVTDGKGQAPIVTALAVAALHGAARAAVEAGHLGDARAMSARAGVIGSWQIALTVHNAHPQLSIEAMLGELGAIEVAAP